jgi:hypothetical protein
MSGIVDPTGVGGNPQFEVPESADAARRLSLLAELGDVIAGSDADATALQGLAEQVCAGFGADACVLRRLSGRVLEVVGSTGIPREKLLPVLPADTGIGRRSSRRGGRW